jgi:hypothetical protein
VPEADVDKAATPRAHEIDLISTRNYRHPKTAVYVHWLVFRDPALAESFLAAWPRYSSGEQIENLRTEREMLAAKIDRRLKTGTFDLSRLPEQDRLPVARRYIELHEKLCELDQQVSLIARSTGWSMRSPKATVMLPS